MLSSIRFHHMAYAVFSIKESSDFYVVLGYEKSETVYDPIQNVYICFMKKDGMPYIELIEPKDDKSPVNKILSNVGVSPYHCCYEVNDIDMSVKELRRLHFMPISGICPAVAIGDDKAVIFLYNKNIGIIELLGDLR